MSQFTDTIGTDYNHTLLNLMKAVEERDTIKIRQTAKIALDSARVMKIPHLETHALCIAATGFLSTWQLSTTLKVYDEAIKIAKAAESTETDRAFYAQYA